MNSYIIKVHSIMGGVSDFILGRPIIRKHRAVATP